MRLLFVLYMRSSDILRGDFQCENFLIEDSLILILEEIYLEILWMFKVPLHGF